MQIVFYSVVLNQHQAPVADCLWELTQHNFVFVELTQSVENKGGTEDYSNRPYLLRAWTSKENERKAMILAQTAGCCVFSGIEALPFEKERMKLGLLSFEMGERWLKQGIKNLMSPRLLKWLLAYHLGGWSKKPLYKLCCSAFSANDHKKLKSFERKCFKWGYFTKVDEIFVVDASMKVSTSETLRSIMWCARFLKWKHPELPVQVAARLKSKGYKFVLDMYGNGVELEKTKALVKELGVEDVVSFKGNIPNDEILEAMRKHEIFLFTSDKNEGWGAVANEAMSNGCAIVASDAIGSVPFLIKNGKNGCVYQSCNLSSLCEKVEWLLDNDDKRWQLAANAYYYMHEVWSPKNAAEKFLVLVDDLKNGRESSIIDGPCSIS